MCEVMIGSNIVIFSYQSDEFIEVERFTYEFALWWGIDDHFGEIDELGDGIWEGGEFYLIEVIEWDE